MRKIDKLHTELPFAGVRMLRDLLRLDGEKKIGRKHVSTLMKKMGIEALYRKPNTSKKHPGHNIYPYLLRHLEINRPNQVWATDTTYSAPNLQKLSRKILLELEHVWSAFRETKEETSWIPTPCY
jgi:putative transposase